jgi:hypothetical protein
MEIAIALIAGTAVVISAWLTNRRLGHIARVAKDTLRQVDAVKIQTDGTLTAAYRAELAAVEAQVVAMRKPAPDTQAAIHATEARLIVMRKALADREATIATVDQRLSDFE